MLNFREAKSTPQIAVGNSGAHYTIYEDDSIVLLVMPPGKIDVEMSTHANMSMCKLKANAIETLCLNDEILTKHANGVTINQGKLIMRFSEFIECNDYTIEFIKSDYIEDIEVRNIKDEKVHIFNKHAVLLYLNKHI